MRGRWKLAMVALTAAVVSVVPPATAAKERTGAPPPPVLQALDLTPLGLPPSSPFDAAVTGELEPAGATPSTTFAGFNSMTPVRFLDTRQSAPVGPGAFVDLQVAGRAVVPVDAAAVVMNVTVTEPTAGGYLTVWPAGTPRPNTSSLNMRPGQTVANLVVVKLGASGQVSIFNDAGTSHVLVDVVAWARDDGHFSGLPPARLLDTRGGSPVGQAGVVELPVLGVGGVPASGVGTVVLNITATQPSAPSYLTVWPTGSPQPNASSLNMVPDQTVPNLVFARVGAGGKVSIFNERGNVHVLADVVGYITSGSAFIPINPVRVMDTRTSAGTYGFPSGGGLLKIAGKLGGSQSVLLDLDSQLVDALDGTSQTTIGAFVFNVTGVDATESTYLTVSPGLTTRPNASTLNLTPGSIVPNAVVVKPGANDYVSIFNNAGAVHVIVDLVGYVPLLNAVDQHDADDASKFHVLYVRGGNSVADPTAAVAAIRGDVAALDGWFALPAQAGRHLNIDRVGADIEVTTVTYPQYSTNQLVNWESDFPSLGVLRQLVDDGFGGGQNRRWLVYFDGNRTDGVCGIRYFQFTTVFMQNNCGTVNGTTVAASVGSFVNAAQVALHEMLHGLGAVSSCAPHYSNQNGGHISALETSATPGVTGANDLMYFNAGVQPKYLDINRDDYFDHNNPNCIDLADSPYIAPA